LTDPTTYSTVDQVKSYAQVNKTATGAQSYKQFGFTSQNDFDTWVATLITWADSAINDFCQRDFWRHPATSGEATELFDGDETTMIVTQWPIISCSQVEIRYGTKTFGVFTPLPIQFWQVEKRFIILTRHMPRGYNNIRVTYAWGYTTVPGTVSLASTRIVSNLLQGALQRSTSPVIKIGDYNIQLLKEEAFTDEIKQTLEPYRRLPYRIMSAGF
jgi:hypothetical protein